MQGLGTLPTGLPRWLARRPQLAAALLRAGNIWASRRAQVLVAAALAVTAILGLLEAAPAAPVLGWLAAHAALTGAATAGFFGIAAARRRDRIIAEAAHSWLAPLPVRTAAASRMTLGTLGWMLGIAAFLAVAWTAGRIDAAAAHRLALASAGGAAIGSPAGWIVARTAQVGAPRFHYAAVHRARARWAKAPALTPLSYWPAAQGRVFGRPKVMSRVLLVVLLSLPLGTPGQVALAIVTLSVALASMLSQSAAAVRVAFAAARWLAPTALSRGRFTVALIWRTLLTQAAAGAAIVFLASALELRRALRLGVPLAALLLLLSTVVASGACQWACRRHGLGGRPAR